jgi:aryl-alcohol dehydrogenase-like predicted oxidoreductase
MHYTCSRRSFLSSMALLPAADLLAAPPTVRYATIGKTGLKVTKFVFGSMITSDQAVIERACDLGINCFASSRDYQKGNNERLLGSALKGRRNSVILCTESIDMMWRPKTEKETSEYVLDNLNASLKELQTDYVDLFFLHHKDEPGWIPDEAVEAVRIAKKQGKMRHAGITTHALPKMADYLVKSDLFEAVISIYNFTMDAETHAAVKKVHDAGIGVIAMKVMAGGLRSEKPLPQMKRPGALMAALKWALNNPNVDAAVTSVASMEQLEENVLAMTDPFTESERQLLAAALDEFGPTYCRLCGRCEGTCRKGLPVPEILRCGMYAYGYGQFDLGRSRFLDLPEEARNPGCGDCPACSVRCAYGLKVAERICSTKALLA